MRTARALLILAATPALAGPLNPPAGQVKSTYKTLADVEPRTAINTANTPGDADSTFRITAPGSYYLTENLLGTAGKAGIEIAVDNVTIDLNGFALLGAAGSLSGITATGREGIAIGGGSVRAWGIHGIDLDGARGCRILDLMAENCGQRGIVAGFYARIDRVTARGCTGTGIAAATDALITGCIAADNYIGFDIGSSSTARSCTAADNATDGFNTTASAAIIEGCLAMGNGGDGFEIGGDALVSGCTARFNAGNGIHIAYRAVILNNHCANNGWDGTGAGIYADGDTQRSRIEGNTCSNNAVGIDVDSGYNLIIANRCTNNATSFEIVANNRVGPIVVMPLSGAISGNAGGTGSADPLANLVF